MDKCLRLQYQRQLIYAGLDDFSPNRVFCTYMGGPDGARGAWEQAVAAFLDESVRCGLLRVVNWKNWRLPDAPCDLQKLLLQCEFGEKVVDRDLIWAALYFFATDDLIGDLRAFGLLSWGALNNSENREFLGFIQKKYNLELGL